MWGGKSLSRETEIIAHFNTHMADILVHDACLIKMRNSHKHLYIVDYKCVEEYWLNTDGSF